jgi:hypothetical protein
MRRRTASAPAGSAGRPALRVRRGCGSRLIVAVVVEGYGDVEGAVGRVEGGFELEASSSARSWPGDTAASVVARSGSRSSRGATWANVGASVAESRLSPASRSRRPAIASSSSATRWPTRRRSAAVTAGGRDHPEEERAEFVNLLRWRLEKAIGYKTTHALQPVNTAGQPAYTMVLPPTQVQATRPCRMCTSPRPRERSPRLKNEPGQAAGGDPSRSAAYFTSLA